MSGLVDLSFTVRPNNPFSKWFAILLARIHPVQPVVTNVNHHQHIARLKGRGVDVPATLSREPFGNVALVGP
jgi:hypothetical protein